MEFPNYIMLKKGVKIIYHERNNLGEDIQG